MFQTRRPNKLQRVTLLTDRKCSPYASVEEKTPGSAAQTKPPASSILHYMVSKDRLPPVASMPEKQTRPSSAASSAFKKKSVVHDKAAPTKKPGAKRPAKSAGPSKKAKRRRILEDEDEGKGHDLTHTDDEEDEEDDNGSDLADFIDDTEYDDDFALYASF